MMQRKPLARKTPLKRTPFNATKKKIKPVPKGVYQEVLARDRGCVARGTLPGACQGRIDPHHVLRRSQGGPDTVENLISLCRAHHSWVHDHVGEAIEYGYLKRAWDHE